MIKKILLFSLVLFQTIAFSQQDAWVYFTDKENVNEAISNPLTILTQKAIDRKSMHGIAIDTRDVPVN
ncbi:MAG: serine protease, partial [Flavobacteriaceae bacterium]|nr:serine protease [Flavobacteriaceae bacterium]